MNIVLIGLPGVGKSTVGAKLALAMERELIETDQLISNHCRQTVRQVYESYGEIEFRELEKKIIESLQGKNSVIVTGGGAVESVDNCTALQKLGRVFYLCDHPKNIIARLEKKGAPAYLKDQSWGVLVERRIPLYEKCADKRVSVTGKTPEQVVSIILETYGI